MGVPSVAVRAGRGRLRRLLRPNRQLFTTYTGNATEMAVAAAIANGVISEAEAGPDLLEILRGGVELARWRSAEKEDEEDAGEK